MFLECHVHNFRLVSAHFGSFMLNFLVFLVNICGFETDFDIFRSSENVFYPNFLRWIYFAPLFNLNTISARFGYFFGDFGYFSCFATQVC